MAGGTFIQLQPQSSGGFGKIGITDVNGEYTYYNDLATAATAATAGQTIIFFTDIVETGAVTVVLPDGVDINLNGFKYTLDNASVDNAISTVSGAVNNIFNGVIERINGTANLADSVALRLDTSTVHLDNVVLVSSGNAIYASQSSIYGDWIVKSQIGIYTNTGTCYFENGTIETTGGNGIVTEIETTVVKCIIKANGEGIIATQPITVYQCLVVGTGGAAINNTGSTIAVYNSTLVATGQAIVSTTGSVQAYNSTLQSLTSNTVRTLSGSTGNVLIYNCLIQSGTSTVVRIDTSGTVEIVGNRIRSTTTSGITGISLENTAATANIVNISDNYIFIVSANVVVPSNGIQTTSTTSVYNIVNNHIDMVSVVAGSAALRAIFSPTTVNYTNNIFKMSAGQPPIIGGITQGIVNTPDLQGNILI